uniref:CAP-Gly domain-containing protein n=1 Tax=Meleagris gallopavo TaxID=9103 RepID=A0A803XRT1_MELGA
VEPHLVSYCPALQPVQVSLNGSTAFRRVSRSSQLRIISKLAEGGHCPLIKVIDEDVEQDRTQHRPLGDTTGHRSPARLYSVRSFLRRRRWGRFDADAEQQRGEEEEQRRAEEAELAATMSPGCRCLVSLPGQPQHRGTIAYVGLTDFKPGHWVGVRYDEPVGKHDGRYGALRVTWGPQTAHRWHLGSSRVPRGPQMAPCVLKGSYWSPMMAEVSPRVPK